MPPLFVNSFACLCTWKVEREVSPPPTSPPPPEVLRHNEAEYTCTPTAADSRLKMATAVRALEGKEEKVSSVIDRCKTRFT